MASTSVCFQCGHKLHNAIFCSGCAGVFCSWNCYVKHSARHASGDGIPSANSPEGGSAKVGPLADNTLSPLSPPQ
jgi:hypothetical protein